MSESRATEDLPVACSDNRIFCRVQVRIKVWKLRKAIGDFKYHAFRHTHRRRQQSTITGFPKQATGNT